MTATTSTCIYHMISNSQYENKTIESNISDHFPILTLLDEKVCPSVKDAQNRKITTWVRNYTFLKNYFVLIRYLFFLNHMLQKIEFHWSIDKKLQTITESFHVALDRFAPYKKINFLKNSWINKNVKSKDRKKTNSSNNGSNAHPRRFGINIKHRETSGFGINIKHRETSVIRQSEMQKLLL